MAKEKTMVAILALLVGTAAVCSVPAGMAGNTGNRHDGLLAAKTEAFHEKEGFERNRKDIINTLKDNDVTRFATLLDGLNITFVDKTVKEKGPFTFFAPSDKAFKKMPDDDRRLLWENKDKLKQVLQYMIVKGEFSGKDLRGKSSIETLNGKTARVSVKGGDLYIDHALVTTTDLRCTNGVIHVLDDVIMPPLSK
ncbi:MAG TPA: fasciclin domain-containing protein [Chroococcales cyanobacterium]